jgi:hypothetical protein
LISNGLHQKISSFYHSLLLFGYFISFFAFELTSHSILHVSSNYGFRK